MMKWWSRWRRTGRIEWKRSEAMTEQQLAECFDGNENAKLWKGVQEVLDSKILELTEDALDVQLPERITERTLGGVSALTSVKAEMQQRMQEMRKRQKV